MSPEPRKPLLLVVMDGWGIAPPSDDNAIALADTPWFDAAWATRPRTQLAASGRAVGLPDGQMGNSEVGHLNLGAGRVVSQDIVRIDDAIAAGSFAANPVFREAIAKIRSAGGRAHLMGLCSPGGVHSSLEHLYALARLLAGEGLEVFLHALTDGRDTPPSSARGFLREIEVQLAGAARVAVVAGRFWTMDRDKRWDRVERGYRAHVQGEGHLHSSADEAIAAAYAAGQTDEFIEPRVIVDGGGAPLGRIRDRDGVFFFNFRADRAREITRALAFPEFDGFARGVVPKLSAYVCMTDYDASFGLPVAFGPQSMANILGAVLAARGLRQFRCAETEKYAHVTFFFNGGVEAPFPGEERQLVPSPKDVPTYDLKPEMSAAGVAEKVLARIAERDDDFILVNFANPDMVGHTGVIAAAITAAETVDRQVARLVRAVLAKGGAAIVTADHGNSEQMRDPVTGEPHTAHTLNPVPLIVVDDARPGVGLRSSGALCDVAPTALELLGIEPPPEMTGRSLIERSGPR
jgi:2,3-bisphosphoglycerate-independent phosphoglycerate mutase